MVWVPRASWESGVPRASWESGVSRASWWCRYLGPVASVGFLGLVGGVGT